MPQDDAAETNGPVAAQDVAVTNFPDGSHQFYGDLLAVLADFITLAPSAPVVRPISFGGGQYVLQIHRTGRCAVRSSIHDQLGGRNLDDRNQPTF